MWLAMASSPGGVPAWPPVTSAEVAGAGKAPPQAARTAGGSTGPKGGTDRPCRPRGGTTLGRVQAGRTHGAGGITESDIAVAEQVAVPDPALLLKWVRDPCFGPALIDWD
jgi:hypothetical protein